MPKIVEVPGLGNVEFPDSMSDDQISNALRKQPAAAEAPKQGNAADEFASGFRENVALLTPVQTIRGLAQAVSDPIGTAKGVLEAQGQVGRGAAEAFQKGDYGTALRKGINYLLPVIGPALDRAGDTTQSGNVARGLGQTAGLAVDTAGPGAVLSRVPGVKVLPKLASKNPVVKSAVEFADRNKIPVPASIRADNKFVTGAQWLSAHTPGGALVARKADRQRVDAMKRTGEDLAGRVNKTSVTPEQAGANLGETLDARAQQFGAEATQKYEALREIEADPINLQTVPIGKSRETGKTEYADIALPVDMRGIKKQLRPFAERYKYSTAKAEQNASNGLQVINQILAGPDFKPASAADLDLGYLKEAARTEFKGLADSSSFFAGKALTQLEQGVQKAVSGAQRSRSVEAPSPGPVANVAPSSNQAATIQGAGSQTKISIPGENRAYNARYELRELSDVNASHSGQTFQRNPNYQLVNDRDYTNVDNQAKVVTESTPERFDPRFMVSDNPDAVNGPMVLDAQGNAIGGNGRAMMLERVYSSNPAGAKAYRQMLGERAAMFGVDPAQVMSMKRPVLVRVVDDADLPTPQAKQQAISDLNKTGAAALRPSERAIAESRRVSPETLDDLAGRIDKAGDDSTLSSVLDGDAGGEVIDRLIKDGVIAPQERAALVDGGIITKEGKQRVSALMLGRFFRNPAQLDSVPVSVKNKLERLAAPLARVEGSDFALTDHLSGALELIEESRAAGATNLGDFMRQGDLFQSSKYSPESVTLARHLQYTGPLKLREMARDYAADAQYAQGGAGLFGDVPTGGDAFKRVFGEVDENGKLPDDWAPAKAPERAPLPEAGPAPKLKLEGVPAGDKALELLRAGRDATVAKYKSADLLKVLAKEPVQVFESTIWQKDTGVKRLRELSREAPEAMSKIGRAYLDDLIGKATVGGGFDAGQSIYNRWNTLGGETKKVLFKNPMLIKDLDDFFMLAKKQSENPNPSGTATTTAVMAQAGMLLTEPLTGLSYAISSAGLAKLLYSPKASRALSKGLRVPLGNKAAAAATAAQILKIAGNEAKLVEEKRKPQLRPAVAY